MKRNPRALADQFFDVLIIGGGIFGAGVARDAALRGLRVALIDKGDFASGTSSRSSKLIHGGFRYLEQRAFRLVAEACRERQILQRIAPHLVRPQPFLLPVYDGDAHSLGTMRLGMTLYDMLARYRNVARHQTLSPERALMREPALSRRGLRGAILFYDCQEDDARFCLDNIVHAADLGAVCANYCEVTGFTTREHRIIAARVRDTLGQRDSFEITARAFVNAAGPWVEHVADLTPFDGHRVALRPTKGVHLLVPRLTQQHAIAFQARSDRRILLALPWGDCSLVGTTDTDWRGDPGDARAEPADVEYLLREMRALLPSCELKHDDIITAFAGVRALIDSDEPNPSARSREHRIVRHGQNLLSIVGGKYTTYRVIAEQTVDQILELLSERRRPCRTTEALVPEHRPPASGERISESPAVHVSDVAHACNHEMAVTIADVMRRRTGLALSCHSGPETAAVVGRLMVPRLGWTDAQLDESMQQYLDEWRRARSWGNDR